MTDRTGSRGLTTRDPDQLFRGHRAVVGIVACGLIALVLLHTDGSGDRSGRGRETPIGELERGVPTSVELARKTEWALGLDSRNIETLPARLSLRVHRIIGSARVRLDHGWRFPMPSGTYWVVSGARLTCLIHAPRGAVTCAPNRVVLEEGLSLGTMVGGRGQHKSFVLAGVAPRGVRGIRVEDGGRRWTLGIRDHIYSATGEQPIVVRRLLMHPGMDSSPTARSVRRYAGTGSFRRCRRSIRASTAACTQASEQRPCSTAHRMHIP
jgi:hypothetical protein